MSVEVKITKNLFGGIAQRIEAGVARVNKKTAEQIAERARQNIMTGPKTGRVYGSHQASAPGESPANETGDLAESITFHPEERRLGGRRSMRSMPPRWSSVPGREDRGAAVPGAGRGRRCRGARRRARRDRARAALDSARKWDTHE
jgi:hypothetical protein